MGVYNDKLKFCADYEFFFKLFKNKKYKYANGKRKELIGYFNTEGVSSKIGFLKTLYYESVVRLNNRQNFIIVFLLAIIRIINKVRNILIYFR